MSRVCAEQSPAQEQRQTTKVGMDDSPVWRRVQRVQERLLHLRGSAGNGVHRRLARRHVLAETGTLPGIKLLWRHAARRELRTLQERGEQHVARECAHPRWPALLHDHGALGGARPEVVGQQYVGDFIGGRPDTLRTREMPGDDVNGGNGGFHLARRLIMLALCAYKIICHWRDGTMPRITFPRMRIRAHRGAVASP